MCIYIYIYFGQEVLLLFLQEVRGCGFIWLRKIKLDQNALTSKKNRNVSMGVIPGVQHVPKVVLCFRVLSQSK